MARAKLNVEFWQVKVLAGMPPFEDLLRQVDALAVEGRNKQYGAADIVRLNRFQEANSLLSGDMLRLRMTDLPFKASKKGPVDDFDFGDDEGVGEHASFLYDPQTKVLALQKRRASVSGPNLAWYFASFFATDALIDLDVVLTPNATEKLTRMIRVTRFEARAATVVNDQLIGEQVEDDGGTTRGFLRFLEASRAPNMHLTLSTGTDDYLYPPVINGLVRLYRRLALRNPKDVKTISLTGRGSNDERLAIDLIEDRLTSHINIDVDSRGRSSFEARRTALLEVFGRYRADFIRLYVSTA